MARRNWKDPHHRFQCQRSAAKARGIGWELTFEQWWEIWRDSGKWNQRGCKRGQYVMARNGDQGIYKVGNVSIMEAGKNGSDGLKGWPAKKKAREDREVEEKIAALEAVDNLQTQPSSLGCRCGTAAASSSADIAIAAQTCPEPLQLYDRPQPDASSHNAGIGDHIISKSTSDAIASQNWNKNLDGEKEFGLTLIEKMGELMEMLKSFAEKKITKQKTKSQGDVLAVRRQPEG